MGGRGASFTGGVSKRMATNAANTYKKLRKAVLSLTKQARAAAPGAQGRNMAHKIVQMNASNLRAARANARTTRREYNSNSNSLFGASTTRQTLRKVSPTVKGASDVRKLKREVAARRKRAAQERRAYRRKNASARKDRARTLLNNRAMRRGAAPTKGYGPPLGDNEIPF